MSLETQESLIGEAGVGVGGVDELVMWVRQGNERQRRDLGNGRVQGTLRSTRASAMIALL